MLMKNYRFLSFVVLFFALLFSSFTTEKNPGKKGQAKSKSALAASKKVLNSAPAFNPYKIIIDKSDYELKVFDEEGWLATYPCVFGSNDLGDKMREGDKRTPEGTFKVLLKKIHPKWGPELLLDYPNPESIQKFNDRKARGVLPNNAKIGNGIAIHATRPDEEWTVDNYQNWTDGCISLKYTEAKDLFSYIPAGTPVTIQK